MGSLDRPARLHDNQSTDPGLARETYKPCSQVSPECNWNSQKDNANSHLPPLTLAAKDSGDCSQGCQASEDAEHDNRLAEAERGELFLGPVGERASETGELYLGPVGEMKNEAYPPEIASKITHAIQTGRLRHGFGPDFWIRKNFGTFDTNMNGFLTLGEIDSGLSGSFNSAEDEAMLRHMRANFNSYQRANNDEWGPENDGITRDDIHHRLRIMSSLGRAAKLTGRKIQSLSRTTQSR